MTEEETMGLAIAEKLFGFFVILIGTVIFYVAYTDPPAGTLSSFSPIFIAAGISLMAVGIFLVLAKTK